MIDVSHATVTEISSDEGSVQKENLFMLALQTAQELSKVSART